MMYFNPKIMFPKCFLITILLLLSSQLYSQSTRVVGYLQYQHAYKLESIDLSQLTHLCVAFANPDANGYLKTDGVNILPIIRRAHQDSVKVLISLAGGAQRPEWKAAWANLMQPWNRGHFIQKIISYVEAYELDGVDFDLEWKSINQHYSGFIIDLGSALHARGKLFTAALPGKHRYPQLSKKALSHFDFINLMAYDLTGPWAPKQSGPHSPYSFAQSSLRYWKNQGVDAKRLVLGLPLYGWDFSNIRDVHAVNYRDIVRANPGYAHLDQVGRLYYNGLLTTIAKVELALEQAGGVMLWELGKDSYDEYSLLLAVHRTINGEQGVELPIQPAVIDTSSAEDEFIGPIIPPYFASEGFGDREDIFSPDELKLNIDILPNPFEDSLKITNREEQLLHLVLTNIQGQTFFETTLQPNASISWETASFPGGYYVVSAMKGKRQLSKQLVKQLKSNSSAARPRDALRNWPQH
jgi:chitinase